MNTGLLVGICLGGGGGGGGKGRGFFNFLSCLKFKHRDNKLIFIVFYGFEYL